MMFASIAKELVKPIPKDSRILEWDVQLMPCPRQVLPCMIALAGKVHPGQIQDAMPPGCQCLCGLPPALSSEIWPSALTCSFLPDFLGPLLLLCMNEHMVHFQGLPLEESLWEPLQELHVWGGQVK